MTSQIKAYFLLAVAMSIAGSSVVAGKLMILNMPVFLAAELGIIASLLFLVPIAFVQRKKQTRLDRQTHLILLMQALFGVVLYRVFIFWGFNPPQPRQAGLSAAPLQLLLPSWPFCSYEKKCRATASLARSVFQWAFLP